MKKVLLAAFLFTHALSFAQMNRLSEQIGNVVKLTPFNGKNSIKYNYELTNAFAEISFYNPTTVRVRVTKEKPKTDFSFAIENPEVQANFSVTESNTATTNDYSTDAIKVSVQTKPFRVSVFNKDGHILSGYRRTIGSSCVGKQGRGVILHSFSFLSFFSHWFLIVFPFCRRRCLRIISFLCRLWGNELLCFWWKYG